MKAASFIKIAFFINKSKRDLRVKVCCATVEVLHRTSKWGEVRLRRTMVSFIGMFTLVHPFATTWHFPSRGNEKIGGTGYCVTYDTDSQSRNAPCVPFRGRGPRSGEGMYEGKNDYDTRCGRDRRKAAL